MAVMCEQYCSMVLPDRPDSKEYLTLTKQGCSLGLERLGLERLGLEAVSRRFFGTSRLVSVLKVERLGLVSVSRVWKNRTSRSRLGLEGSTSRSRSRDFSLVNMHAMRIYHKENNGSDPQKTRCQVRDFTSWCF